MKKTLVFLIFTCWAALSFAQNNKEVDNSISQLAKKQAQAICDCPVNASIAAMTADLLDKKISPEKFKEGIKVAMVQMMKCLYETSNEVRMLSIDEYVFFKEEVETYRLELCATNGEKK